MASSLDKAFHVLEVLADAGGELPLVEIVGELGYHKPTVHRLLQELVDLGYVARVEKGKYELTGKLRRLTLGKLDDRLVEVAMPALRALHDRTDETVNLGVKRGSSIRYLQVFESRHPFRRVVDTSSRDPFYSTALGRAITSQMNEEEWRTLISRTKIQARTPATVVDPDQLWQIHLEVQKQGYAIEQDQNDLGVTCIGSPVFEKSEIVAAISISIPTARFLPENQQELIDAVIQTARTISTELAP